VNTLDFQLFRVQVYLPKQEDMFEPIGTRKETLRETITSLPSVELRTGMIWRIGNVSPIDKDSLYFRVGRVRKTKLEVYKDGNFQELDFEQAPYTHVILDLSLEVCAIARKVNLSTKIYGIASQLSRLLNRSEVAQRLRTTFGIGSINDPTDFIVFLREAAAVQKLWLKFTLPNAWDASDDFEKPFKATLREINGKKGSAQFEGEDLQTEALEDLLRSVASVGNDAGALVELQEEDKRVKKRKHIRDNPIIISQEEIMLDEHRVGLLKRIREKYNKVRGKESNRDEQ
jgi:hypothetical protein